MYANFIQAKKRFKMKKKIWEKPKLVVLFRGKPEEAVLQGCKVDQETIGARDYNSSCYQPIAVLCTEKCLTFTGT